jgi:Sulfotransferase family
MTETARQIFVCGLHRSGTSLLCRTLATHPLITGFENTGVIEDEGQFLQDVLPLDVQHGGAGRFGFDPAAHMTEAHPLNSPHNAQRIFASWSRHWDMNRPLRIEKTPASLLRMRLLQGLFPGSAFIIMTRHPVASCLATVKWTQGNMFSLISHWQHCYTLARQDCDHLSAALWVSYEAFVADPAKSLERIARFLALSGWNAPLPATSDQNAAYFALWQSQWAGDQDRRVPLILPGGPRGPVQRIKQRLDRMNDERRQPAWRQRSYRQQFHDALDAMSLHEPVVRSFGYSFADLARKPAA